MANATSLTATATINGQQYTLPQSLLDSIIASAATSVGSSSDKASPIQVDQCLEMIISSWQESPLQTPADTVEITRQIAQEVFGNDDAHSVMQVAGVRSHLLRGSYDDNPEASSVRQHILNYRNE